MKIENTTNIFQKTTIRLLSRLEKIVSTENSKVIYITSSGDKEGKSFVASSIASHAAAMSDNKVLLIDGNMDTPDLHNIFEVGISPGLSDVLLSGEWQGIPYQPTKISNLYVLPAGGMRKSGLLFKQHVMKEFLAAIKSQFDLIIFDSASVLRSGANSIVNLADGIVMVIDASSTREQVLSYAMSELNVENEKVLGAILNKKIRYIPRFIYERA